MPAPRPHSADHADETLATLGLRIGDAVGGKFRVDELAGVGGMSFVLRATHIELDETVALKCLNPQWRDNAAVCERFSREARAAVKIKNDHVARVYDVGKLPGGIPYMVMEFLRGEDLGKVLDRGDTLEVRDAVGFVLEACEGLSEAHALGIVHRDVKPENLFLVQRPNGRVTVKLLDFGISKQLLLPGNAEELDRTRELLGTPLYMSPEQVRSSKAVDHRTDIWSLGTVFYELLSGHAPFSGSTITEVCANIIETVPEPPRRFDDPIPEELGRIVLRCLEKDLTRRYASVAELAVELLPFAHPLHHARVDRIVSTLRAAGLTELAPHVLSSPTLSSPYTRADISYHPTLVDHPRSENPVSRSAQSGRVATTSAFAETKALPPPSTRRRNLVLIGLLAAVATLVLITVARMGGPHVSAEASAPRRAASGSPAPPPPAPNSASTASAAASAPQIEPANVVAPAASATPSADAGPASSEAQPKRALRPRAAAPANRARPSAAPSAHSEQPRLPPPPRLDIELSR